MLGVIIVAAVGLSVYRSYIGGTSGITTAGSDNPRAVVEVVGVKTDLIAIAHGERDFQALNGRYATLEETLREGNRGDCRGRSSHLNAVEAKDLIAFLRSL